MMKKLLLILMLFAFATMGFAQTTYYWAGGATASSLTGVSWSTTLGGAASTSRSATDDILVFDNVTVAFDITTATVGRLVIQNNSDVTFTRSLSAAGTATLTLSGAAGVGLEVNNAKLRLNGSTASYNISLSLASGITGSVSNAGQVYISGTASNRIIATSTGILTFATGTSCFINSVGVQPFSTYSAGNNDNSVFFDNGSNLNYQGGLSPFGNTTGGNITKFAPNSNFIFETAPASGFLSSRIFGNVLIKSGVTLSLASENFIKLNDLTIESGATFNLRLSGGNAVTGNILVNGTLGVSGSPTSSQLIMAGASAQSISGSGTINSLGCFSVASDANVTLAKSLVISGTSTSNIIGRLNFGTNNISGTCNIQFRSASNLTDPNGSITSGSNTVSMGNITNYNALSPTVGLLVSGIGIPANSYIIGTSSTSFNFTISNFATATATGVTISTTGGAATFSTSNISGPDASLTTTGNGSATKSISSGTNLIINTATSAPIPATFFTSTSAQSNISFGNVTFNGTSTTNADATINGALTLNGVKLNVRTGDNLTMSSTSSFAGAYSNTAYVATSANSTTGAVGILKLFGLVTSKSVPVGTATNYLPVTLNPTTSSDFSINVFQGATADATSNGTALTAGQKADAVDAIYNIVRTTGSGNCDITFGWQAALEGANFTSFTNPQIGVAQYTGGSYTTFLPSAADNSLNTATITTTSFAPFLIGKTGTTLPVKLIAFTAKAVNQTAVINWQSTSEVNLDKFNIQRSLDGVSFEAIGTVKANNKDGIFNYSFVDKSPAFGANYYRLVSVDLDGSSEATGIASVNFGSVASLSVYPNPTQGDLNLVGLVKGDFIRITDLVGRTVKTQQFLGENILTLNMDNLNAGIYLVSVETKGKVSYSSRIIKN